MNVKVDEVQCQILKVSGANKIETAVDVTDGILGLETVSTEATTLLASVPTSFTLAKVAGAANEVDISIKPQDADGDLAGVRNLEVFTSDEATGAGLSSTFAPDSLAADTGKGAIISELTANKHAVVQTNAAGEFVLVLTDAGTSAGYFVVVHPMTGLLSMIQIEAGDYGV